MLRPFRYCFAQREVHFGPGVPEAADLKNSLVIEVDGTFMNPDGIDDPKFFEDLEDIRRRSRNEGVHNPFEDNWPNK